MPFELGQFIQDFATALVAVDARRPTASSSRNGSQYQAGIGPHPESATVNLVMEELRRVRPDIYTASRREVPYTSVPRQKCDICFGSDPDWCWSVEIKMLRVMGDNGKPNDNILMHILSPYPVNRSAVTDCGKLLQSGLPGRKAIVIFAYEYPDYPAEPVIRSFELVASDQVTLGPRQSAAFSGLVHPVHQSGRVFAWEISTRLVRENS
jgi:hypothetical protein